MATVGFKGLTNTCTQFHKDKAMSGRHQRQILGKFFFNNGEQSMNEVNRSVRLCYVDVVGIDSRQSQHWI